jgi:hypothetical protein
MSFNYSGKLRIYISRVDLLSTLEVIDAMCDNNDERFIIDSMGHTMTFVANRNRTPAQELMFTTLETLEFSCKNEEYSLQDSISNKLAARFDACREHTFNFQYRFELVADATCLDNPNNNNNQ